MARLAASPGRRFITVILACLFRAEVRTAHLRFSGKLFYPPELSRQRRRQPTSHFITDDLVFFGSRSLTSPVHQVDAPNEIWSQWTVAKATHNAAAEDGEPVTQMNDALLSKIDMQPLESFTFKGANNEQVQGFMVKPPGFDPNKKYPMKFLIHGGPQGAWGN